MNFENEIFKRSNVDFKKLIEYGFEKENDHYTYSKEFMDNFKADILIDKNGGVTGKVFDLSINDEYINFRIESQNGEFVNLVRKNYTDILNDINEKCFDKKYFITNQANRIARLIIDKYGDQPIFAWDKFKGFGIFKNPNNNKWYGLIMNIDKSKIDKKSSGEVEVINVKVDSNIIDSLLKQKGIYPSYHMNKKNWVSITLDETLKDDEIMNYVTKSHKYTEVSDEWIVPANPKYYDIINCFNETDIINWKQSSNIKVGDIVYLYVASPYSAILYKCEAVEVNIPYEFKNNNLSINKIMRIKLLKRFKENEYTFDKLGEYGIKAIRGPRNMPLELSKEINKNK